MLADRPEVTERDSLSSFSSISSLSNYYLTTPDSPLSPYAHRRKHTALCCTTCCNAFISDVYTTYHEVYSSWAQNYVCVSTARLHCNLWMFFLPKLPPPHPGDGATNRPLIFPLFPFLSFFLPTHIHTHACTQTHPQSPAGEFMASG